MCVMVLKLQMKAVQFGQSKMCRSRDSDQLSPQDAGACYPASLCLEEPWSSWVPKPLRNSPEWLSITISAQPSQSILGSLGTCSSSPMSSVFGSSLCLCGHGSGPVLSSSLKMIPCAPVAAWPLWAALTTAVTAPWIWGGVPVCAWVIQKQNYIQDTFPAAIHGIEFFFSLI